MRLGLVAAFFVVTATGGAATPAMPTLRLASPTDVETLDPALAFDETSWGLLRASCTTLMDIPGRTSRSRHVIVPGGAAGFPRVSRDGRTYTFTIRRDVRFSDGTQVRAAHYARALGRVHNPAMRSQIGFYVDDIESARASGFTLRIRLRKPRGDFLSRAAMPFTCPVPLNFPVDPAGVDLRVGSGPYYVASRTQGRQIVLRPNIHYRGPYRARFSAIVFTVAGTSDSLVRDTDAGRVDYAYDAGIFGAVAADLVRRHGVGRGRLFYKRGLAITYLAFNLRRGAFSQDVGLRRAVNFALDRPEIIRQRGPFSDNRTDQMLPPSTPGFRNADLYPLKGASVRTARRLAGNRLRGRTVVLYSRLGTVALKQAEVIAYNLRQLGADVEVKAFATPVLFLKLNTPGEPWDLTGTLLWFADVPDPYNFVGPLFAESPDPKSNNVSGFASRRMVERIQQADRLRGAARYRALGELEIELMRQYVPVVPISSSTGLAFVSRRLGCVTFNAMGELDLRKTCLRA